MTKKPLNLSTLLTDQEMAYINLALIPADVQKFRLILTTLLGKLERRDYKGIHKFCEHLDQQFPKIEDITKRVSNTVKQHMRDQSNGYAQLWMKARFVRDAQKRRHMSPIMIEDKKSNPSQGRQIKKAIPPLRQKTAGQLNIAMPPEKLKPQKPMPKTHMPVVSTQRYSSMRTVPKDQLNIPSNIPVDQPQQPDQPLAPIKSKSLPKKKQPLPESQKAENQDYYKKRSRRIQDYIQDDQTAGSTINIDET